jgi:uncharacterized damage-inducible protein DinB
MKSFILYNWEIRDDWFRALSKLPTEELTKDRNAGIGTILKTLLHIIDVEYSWIRAINNKADFSIDFEDYRDLNSVIELSNKYRAELKEYLQHWKTDDEDELVKPDWMSESYTKGEIIRHVIAHEIHHIGQLSIWARELGVTPISSNFIGRAIKTKLKNLWDPREDRTFI